MTYKEYKNESYNLYTIKTDKFKICHMEIIFYNKLKKEDITIMNVLSDMLAHSSKKYPKRKYVVEKLEDLYNANFMSGVSRAGNVMTYGFAMNFLDPIYTDKTFLKDVINFPFEMLFNPNIVDDEFDIRSFKIIKSRNQADIDAVKESPVRYALKKCLNIMDSNHPASYKYVGYQEDLDKITPSKLVKKYHEFINNSKCDIFIVGNLNMDKINIMINELFRNNIIKNTTFDVEILPKKYHKVKDITEYGECAQASLFCVYNTENLSAFEKDYVMPVFNMIFGKGSLTTKLYQNLREKNSLCYNVNSMYQKLDNLLIISSGIDAKNKTKAVKLIKKSLAEMQNGDFNQDDVDYAIKNIINGMKISQDNPSSLCNNYFFHNLINTPLFNEKIEHITDVNKQDIINVAKKIKLNIVYMMAPGGKDERN